MAKTHLDGFAPVLIACVCPFATVAPLWTGHGSLLPIHRKARDVVAFCLPCLPMDIPTHRPHQPNLLLELTREEYIGIDIARIHQMIAWREVFLGQRFMNRSCHFSIRNGSIGGFHVRNQMHLLFVAGLGQMDLLTRANTSNRSDSVPPLPLVDLRALPEIERYTPGLSARALLQAVRPWETNRQSRNPHRWFPVPGGSAGRGCPLERLHEQRGQFLRERSR